LGGWIHGVIFVGFYDLNEIVSRGSGIMTVASEHAVRESRRSITVKKSSQLLDDRHKDWKAGLPAYVTVPAGELPSMIAVGGGKGGVGKSLLSANLASKLAMIGYRVLVVDLDLGCANIHTHFGIPKPKYTLANFLLSGDKSFAEIVTPTTVPGVALVAGGQEAVWGQYLTRGSEALLPLWDVLLRSRQQMQADFVIMDLGAGTLSHTLDFFTSAHLGIITALPEPTSIENAYVFIKTYLWHLIDHIAVRLGQPDAAADIRTALLQVGKKGYAKGYAEAFQGLSSAYPEMISGLLSALRGRSIGFVINQTRSRADVEIGHSMKLISKRYFGFSSEFLGDLNYDDSAWKSLRNRRLLLQDFPHSTLSRRFDHIIERILLALGYGE